MSPTTLKRVQYSTEVVASQINPRDLGDAEVVHYSIPAIQDTGRPAIEPASEIASNKWRLQGGEVLVSKLNVHKNCTAIVERHDDLPLLSSTEFVPLVPKDIEARYLKYVFQSEETIQHLGSFSESATRSHSRVNPSDITKLKIHQPDFGTQTLVANYLDRETARIDGLIAEKERMLALLEEKRAALISRVVIRGLDPNAPLKPSGQEWLGEIPAHWDVCQLKRTWASSDYGLSDSIRDEGDVSVLRMSCIVDGRIDVSKSGRITEVDNHLLLRRNDLLFNRTNSLDQIAKVGLLDFDPEEPLTFASYLVRIRSNHRATPQYLVEFLNASVFLKFARRNAIPAIGQANLSPTRYGEIHIPLPPKPEQEDIIAFLDRDARTSTPIRQHIRSSIDLLKERRASLITAAVTGQLPLEEMAK